jgi:oxygen-independent coproporphyrinogen-3 oxidase
MPNAPATQGLRPSLFPKIDDALLARLDRPAPRYTSYPTAPIWREDFGAAEHARALREASNRTDEPLSLYVHIPFCREMCTYCGCNVIVSKDPSKVERYVDGLLAELALVRRELDGRRKLGRVHVGGGTPTTLDDHQLIRLWRGIVEHCQPQANAEIAIEIDPVATTEGQIDLLASLGFNRVSFGVQDFDPEVQQTVRRIQTVDQTWRMVDRARSHGIDSVNFDLIFGLPRQTKESWQRTLEQVIALGPDRLAVYSFAYVPEARPNQRVLPVADIATGRQKLELFGLAYDTLVNAGYLAIGMDHFARPSDELAKAHAEGRLWRDFQGFTVRRAPDTVGIGVSAIATLSTAIAQNEKKLGPWSEAVHAGRLPVERGIALSDDDRRRRDVIIGLMANDAVDLGAEAETRYAVELGRLRELEQEGLVVRTGHRLELTSIGRLFSRNVAMVFDAHLAGTRAAFSRTV